MKNIFQKLNRFSKDSIMYKAYEKIINSPLCREPLNTRDYQEPIRSCPAGNMPEGDFSGMGFLNSEFHDHLWKESEKI